MSIEPTVINITSFTEGGEDIVIDGTNIIKIDVTLGGIDNSGIMEKWPKISGQNIMNHEHTVTCYVTALIVEAGGLLLNDPSGGIPYIYNNSLLASNATVIDGDLFS